MSPEESYELFDVAAVEAGAWAPGPYGAGDERGTYNELGPHTIAAALGLLDLSRPLRTFDLGYVLYQNPASYPDRPYSVTLEPQGPERHNRISHLQERAEISFNLGTKVNGLHHAGVGNVFYGGRQLPDIVAANGIGDLDAPGWGPPVVARGFLLDVLALKASAGADHALDQAPGGMPTLAPHYRVTVEDLEDACHRQKLPTFEPGDALLIHTGWARQTPPPHLGLDRFPRGIDKRAKNGNPGVWLRECEWLAGFRPAVVGADTPMWGTDNRDVTGGAYGAAHQLLLTKHGVRIGESMQFVELVEAGVDQFVYCHNWLRGRRRLGQHVPVRDRERVTPTKGSTGPRPCG